MSLEGQFFMSPDSLVQAAMAKRNTSVSELRAEFGIKPVTLYRYVGPEGQLREQGTRFSPREPVRRVVTLTDSRPDVGSSGSSGHE